MNNAFLNSQNVLPAMKEIFLQEGIGRVADFSLKPSTDVSILVSSLSTVNINSEPTESPKEVTGKMFDAIQEFLTDENNIAKTECIDKTSKGLSVALENGFRQITGDIHDMVDDLDGNIQERFIKILRSQKADNLISDKVEEPSRADFTFIGWDKLKSPGIQNEIIEAACADVGTKPALSKRNLGFVVGKIGTHQGFVELNLAGEVKDSVLEKLKTVFANDTYNITEAQVTWMVDVLTLGTSHRSANNNAKSLMSDPRKIAQNCLSLSKIADDVDIMCGSIVKHIDGMIDTVMVDVLVRNIEVVMKTVNAMKYFCVANKEMRFAGQLILSGEIINEDAFESYSREGGTINKMYEFIKANYSSASIPLGGVSMAAVLESDVEEQLIKVNAKMRTDEKFIKSKALVEAFNLECGIFLKSYLTTLEGTHTDRSTLITLFSRRTEQKAAILSGHTGKVTDALYDLIINTFHSDTLVKTLFKYLGASFADITSDDENSEITDSDVVKAEAFASTTMMVEYLMEQLCVK